MNETVEKLIKRKALDVECMRVHVQVWEKLATLDIDRWDGKKLNARFLNWMIDEMKKYEFPHDTQFCGRKLEHYSTDELYYELYVYTRDGKYNSCERRLSEFTIKTGVSGKEIYSPYDNTITGKDGKIIAEKFKALLQAAIVECKKRLTNLESFDIENAYKIHEQIVNGIYLYNQTLDYARNELYISH